MFNSRNSCSRPRYRANYSTATHRAHPMISTMYSSEYTIRLRWTSRKRQDRRWNLIYNLFVNRSSQGSGFYIYGFSLCTYIHKAPFGNRMRNFDARFSPITGYLDPSLDLNHVAPRLGPRKNFGQLVVKHAILVYLQLFTSFILVLNQLITNPDHVWGRSEIQRPNGFATKR